MKASFPRAVIFDWDNTLVDSWGAIGEALNATRACYHLPAFDRKQVIANGARSARQSFPEMFGDNWQEAYMYYYEVFGRVQLKGLTPAYGAESVLRWLNEKQVPLCVVSNKNGPYLRKEAVMLGWDKYFLSIVGATDAKRDKPAREHADHALALAGLEGGKDVWFVGDSEADILCARNTGCTPLLIGTAETAEILKVDMFVADCEKLQELLSERQRAIG